MVQILTRMLEAGRIHPALILHGTRGVGKTTIARILAASLNCTASETTTSAPCGTCDACVAISQGRWPDYIEIDAAANNSVENVRDIIEQMAYPPTVGRYKVYVFDEAHMLTKAAFNSMLKVLEEPPPGVVFAMATTEDEKIPRTVKSRCMRLTLRPVSPEQVQGILRNVATVQQIEADDAALRALALAGNGSVRDSLTLMEQAVAYGAGSLTGDDVQQMLGMLGQDEAFELLQMMARQEGEASMNWLSNAHDSGADADHVICQLLSAVHETLLAHELGGFGKKESVGPLASQCAKLLSPERLQLWWDLLSRSRADLGMAPSERAGLEMAILRVMAFDPVLSAQPTPPSPQPVSPHPRQAPAAAAPTPPSRETAPPASPAPVAQTLPTPKWLQKIGDRRGGNWSYVDSRDVAGSGWERERSS